MTRVQITIDCRDPDALVPFWCLALDYKPAPPPAPHATWRDWYVSVGVPEAELEGDCQDRIEDPTGEGPSIWFQVVPEPKTVKNRVHLDIRLTPGRSAPVAERAAVIEAKAAALVAAGATRVCLHDETEGQYAITLQDPEGNELCLT